MRANVWTAAIVVAGLGVAVALAGWMGGEGREVVGQEAQAEQGQRADALPAGTNIELIIHRVVPGTSVVSIGRQDIYATRDGAAMLMRIEGVDAQRDFEDHAVWFSLVNHTDRGYLISENTLQDLVRHRVRYTDADGRVWETFLTAMGHPDPNAAPQFNIPIAPQGRHEMVVHAGFMRFRVPEDPARAGHALEFPGTLGFDVARSSELLAQPIDGAKLGSAIMLTVDGRGTCEVGFDGPM